MKLNNKIFLIFFLLLAFILFFNINNVFAFTFSCNNGNFPTDVIDISDVSDEYLSYFDLPYIISTNAGNYEYTIRFLADDSSYFYVDGDHIRWSGTIHQFGYSGGNWDYRFNNERIYGVFPKDKHIFYNSTIYSDVEKSDIFFQVPVTGVVIPALETAQQIPETIVKTLKILIPVGLVVLAVGLIIYLIKRVIYSTQ